MLVHLPESGVQEGIVGDTVQRKKISKRARWVWVNVKGSWILVREENLRYKAGEPYSVEFDQFVETLQEASLVKRLVKKVEGRVRTGW